MNGNEKTHLKDDLISTSSNVFTCFTKALDVVWIKNKYQNKYQITASSPGLIFVQNYFQTTFNYIQYQTLAIRVSAQ